MMTTALGSLRAATVLVIGLGVAGLSALATVHRLGAITEGYDVRPETKEQAKPVLDPGPHLQMKRAALSRPFLPFAQA